MACGGNNFGQLGDGTTIVKSTPVSVSSLSAAFIAVETGGEHSLFLKSDGTVWACGKNNFGQLGDGTTTDKSTPVQISSLSGIIAISAGSSYSLFLKNDSTVWACGYNASGQLGDGTTIDKSAPIQVSSLIAPCIAIAAGHQHSLFLKNDSTVWACGYNNTGQLGDGTTTDKSTPVQVSSLSTPCMALAAGVQHSLFLKTDGTAWACGGNNFGQLGNGTTTNTSTPIQVSSLNNITAVAGGGGHSLFLKNDGSVWACGRNNYGQLGDGTTTNQSLPFQISTITTSCVAIATGLYHSLFLKNDGTAWACGRNSSGELGDGTIVNKSTPVQVISLCTMTDIEKNSIGNRISVYPNPFTSATTLQTAVSLHNATITVYNCFGQTVKEIKNISGQSLTLQRDNLPSGMYFVRLTEEYKINAVHKLVITD